MARVGRDRRLGLLRREQERKYAARRSAKSLCKFGAKCSAFLEKTCGEIRWRVGENVFGALEKMCSVIWRKRVRQFWRKRVWRFWAIMRRRFGEIVRRFWRKRFGDNVGVLEKRGRRGYGDFVLEFATKQHSARRP